MSKGDDTRNRILGECARQTAARGLGGVSLNDIAAAVGMSKSGLFKHFESKEEMQHAVLEQVLDHFLEFVWRPAEELTAGRKRLQKVFDRWLKWNETECVVGGCPIAAASVELDDQPGKLRDYLQMRMRRWHDRLTAEMQQLRDPPMKEDEARRAVFQMRSFILGYGEARRLMEDPHARRAARAAFDSLLDRTEHPPELEALED
jgi:AcrR family transcriptional regulator